MDNDKKFKNPLLTYLIISLVATCILNLFISLFTSPNKVEINYSDFMEMLENNEVDEVELQSSQILIKRKDGLDPWVSSKQNTDSDTPASPTVSPSFEDDFLAGVQLMNDYIMSSSKNIIYYTGNVGDPEIIKKLDSHDVNYYTKVPNYLMNMFQTWVLPVIIMFGLFWLLMSVASKKLGGRGGFMSFGESNAKIYMENKTGITFADVAGQEEAKDSLNEIVDFLHNPAKYTEIGARQPKGALLVGPPGTGKTLLAKAVAGEANVPFFFILGSDFVEMFVGVGASRVRDLFKQASQKAPCIIFIDEVDAIGKSRESQYGGNDEREQTLNQLLAEMDGFDSSKGVVIIAATNRPEILDKALLRPGRFDRRIIVEKPDLKGREDILKVHSKNVKMGDDIDLHEIALATSGAVGADLANMVNEAALGAVRAGRKKVSQADLMEAVEVIIAGKEKKDRILSEKEKRIVAFHEVGHALAAALQKDTQPVQKITIVPRTMGALGYTMQMPEEEHYLMSKNEIIEQITVCLAGRCAEELVFDISTTGAMNDIERATGLARNMVAQYGMSDKFGMMELESVQNRYLDGRAVANCSEATLAELDKEVISILKNCHDTAMELLKNNIEALERISEFLIEKENITGDEFMKILNEVRSEKNDADGILLSKTNEDGNSLSDNDNAEISEDTEISKDTDNS